MTPVEGSKEIILEAALAEFAEKGFDGARIDAVAKRAGVNKALIYYYFKSKEELLEKIFQSELSSLESYTQRLFDLQPTLSRQTLEKMMREFLALAETKKNLIALIMSESVIHQRGVPYILRLNEYAVKYGDHYTAKHPKKLPPVTDRTFHELFTGILPLCQYVLFKDSMAEHYGVSLAKLEQRFIDFFLRTHIGFQG